MLTSDLPRVAILEQCTQVDPWHAQQIYDLATLLLKQEYLGWVCESGAQVWAYALVRPILDECELITLGVHPDLQGQGIGRLLLSHVHTHLPEAVRVMHLEVRESNAPAIRLYERLGYVAVGCRKAYYSPVEQGGQREDARLMCVDLTVGAEQV